MSVRAPRDEEGTKDQVLHEVDGIQEYDNALPNWWLYALYATILFSAVYWFHYEVGGFGQSPEQAYQAEVEKAAAARAEQIKAAGMVTKEALDALALDKGTVDQGAQVFASTCAACHRNDGGGVVGPNLTDEFWLHGGASDAVYKTITEGVPDKGMPSWAAPLGPARVSAVTAYVLSLRGKNVTGGKAPQGTREELTLQN